MMRTLPSTNAVRPTQAGATTGKAVRGLVEWAVTHRRTLNKYGWSKPHAATMEACVRRLEAWLAVNFCPSTDTVARLWREHESTLRYVMPGTAAGKAKLRQLETLINTL